MLTKIFRARSSTPLSLSRAWAYAAINQLAFPGLGTILAGRRSGYVEAAVMLAGFFLTMGFMLCYFSNVIPLMMHGDWTEAQYQETYRPYAWAGISGLILCVIAWCWSLVSSIAILRAASSPAPPESKQ